MKASFFAFLAYAGACASSFACGPWFPPSYIDGPDRSCRPSVSIERELELLASEYGLTAMGQPKFKPSPCSSVEAELKDFKEALAASKAPQERKDSLLVAYSASVDLARKGHEFPFKAEEPELQEFELYLQGWKEMVSNSQSNVFISPKGWTELLALPREQRRCRTVWTHYMLGNLLSAHGKDEAGRKQYELCRKAASDGFADSAGLAYSSYLRQFLSERNAAERLKSGLLAWSYYRDAKDADREKKAFDNIKFSMSLNKKADDLKTALDDPAACEILLAGAMKSWSEPSCSEMFLLLLEGRKAGNGERAAYAAYKSGSFKAAKRWLELTPDSSLLKHWLAGKLLRIDGDYAGAAKEFRLWLELAGKLPKDSSLLRRMEFKYDGERYEMDFIQNVQAELGESIALGGKEFLDALHCFMLARSWPDAAFVAEKLLDSKALRSYVEANCPPEDFNAIMAEKDEAIRGAALMRFDMRHLLARRLFREGDASGALAFMPANYATMLCLYLSELEAAKNPKLGADERALHLYNAGKAMRVWGMEFAGTELQPDYSIDEGDFENEIGKDFLKLRPELDSLVKSRDPSPNERFHYRYLASNLEMKAGSEAKDRTLKAFAFYAGGSYIMARNPKLATPLYRKLIRECNDDPIADMCIKSKWFSITGAAVIRNEIFSGTPAESVEALKKISELNFDKRNRCGN